MTVRRSRGWLVVSLHDVCPRTAPETRLILTALAREGVPRCSLLVIPADAAGPAVDADPAFARYLRARAGGGDELVQHGLYHARPAGEAPPDGLPGRVDALLARGAGEFAGLDPAEARRRLDEGRARLAAAGLGAPAGFVAPGWLYSGGAAAAVADAGFRYFTTHLRLRDLAAGRDHWSFGISNRPGALGPDLAGRGVNTALTALHGGARLVRLAVHPADVRHAVPFDHTLRLLRALLAARRRPVTYAEYLDAAGAP